MCSFSIHCRPFCTKNRPCRTLSHRRCRTFLYQPVSINGHHTCPPATRRQSSLPGRSQDQTQWSTPPRIETFERRGQATDWAARVEKQLSEEEGDRHEYRQLHGGSLRRILRKYRKDVSEVRPMGRSKTASIRFLETVPIAGIPVLDLRTSDLIQHVRERRKSGAGPSTVNNDLIWLRVIRRYARAAWGLPFDLSIVDDACEVSPYNPRSWPFVWTATAESISPRSNGLSCVVPPTSCRFQ